MASKICAEIVGIGRKTILKAIKKTAFIRSLYRIKELMKILLSLDVIIDSLS